MTDYLDSIRNHEFLLNFNTIENATEKQHINVGAQCNFTPLVEIEKRTGFRSLKHITPNMKKVLFMFNIEFIEYVGIVSEKCPEYNYLKNIEYTVAYDSEFDKRYLDMFICRYNLNVKPVNIIEFSDTNNIKVIKKCMTGKHFDIVFSNPPYASAKNVGLDIKILMSALEVANESIFIQPSAWALRTVYKMKIQKDLIKLYGKNVKRLIFVSPDVFGSGCKKFEPLLISHIDKSKTFDKILVNDSIKNVSYEANSINDVNLFALEGKWDIVRSIINKLNSYMEKHGRCSDFIIPHDKINEYSVWISLIRGNASNRYTKNGSYNHAFCSVINQDDSNKINPSTVLKPRDLWVWSFNSNIERDNFINYCKTKIARFSQAIYKFDGNVNMGDVPWFDFQNEISDEYAVKKLKLSEDEWNYINTFIEK